MDANQEIQDKFGRLTEGDQHRVMEYMDSMLLTTEPHQIASYDSGTDIPMQNDSANRASLVTAIARLIAGEGHFRTYSINGPWGSGKSVFLKWLCEELQKKHQEKLVTVHFSAWEYQGTQNLVYAMLHQFVGMRKAKDHQKEIDRLLKALAIIGAASFMGWSFGIASVTAASGVAKFLEQYFVKRQQDMVLGAIAEVRREFDESIQYVLDAYCTRPTKVVFLIDELDRCSIENVLVLLESVKTFLQSDKVVTVFAIDKTIVSQSIRAKYGNLPAFEGEDYLNKIVEFPVELPFDSELVTRTIMSRFPKQAPFIASLNLEFVPLMVKLSGVRSIRALQKVFTRFIVVSTLASGLPGPVRGYDPRVLFVLLFIYEVYPQAYSVLQHANMDKGLLDKVRGFNYQQTPTFGGNARKLFAATENSTLYAVITQLVHSANKTGLSFEEASLGPCWDVLNAVGT